MHGATCFCDSHTYIIQQFVFTHVRIYMQNVWTPLMAASFKGHVNIVRLLIEAKAQINIQDEVCYSYHIL